MRTLRVIDTICLKSILFFLVFVFSFSTKAQSDISVGSVSKRAIKVLNENHLQPRVLNEMLAKSIHENIMSSMDDDQIFFTKENISSLEEQLPNLVTDLENGNETYLNVCKSIFNENLERIKGFHKAYFASDIDVHSKLDMDKLFEGHVSESQLQSKWDLFFRNTIINRVLGKIEEQEYKNFKDSLDPFIAASKIRIEEVYGDYFNNISEDISFLDNLYLNAIAKAYDPHSSYFSFSQKEQFKQELSSERELFGISYIRSIKGDLEVHKIVPGSSAWLSGEVHVGDIMRSIKFGDEETISLKGKTSFQLNKLFDKNTSDKIVITLENENDGIKKVELLKSKVYSDEDIIKSSILSGEKKIGFISLPDFYTNWNDDGALGCANDLAKTLIKLKKENIDGVILDLRDNGGGSLKEAIDLTGIFIDFGPVLVVSGEEKPETLKDFNRGSIYNGPMIVMINENSASASEVVAGALQDYNRAVIVGQPSFGKATGQSIYPVAPESVPINSDEINEWGYLKITEMGLYRINLETNQFNGVTPDILLEYPFDYDPFREKDYPNVIHLDSIDKKMYYTAQTEIDMTSIAAESKERQVNTELFIGLKAYGDAIDSLYEGVEFDYLTLQETIDLEKKIFELSEKLESLYDEINIEFKSESLQYDQDVYKMSEYMNIYKEAFHKEVESDEEIAEAFNIMLELINK